ncbi:MAG: hypothetical protein ACSLE1_16770 [Sphingobium sp.]
MTCHVVAHAFWPPAAFEHEPCDPGPAAKRVANYFEVLIAMGGDHGGA